MGWIGSKKQLFYVLDSFGVNRDPDGKIRWWGNGPALFLGLDADDADVVVDDTAEVEIAGKRVPVCSLLKDTSYGCQVTVI